MKIGFDVSQTGKQKAGCGFFADGLIRHLAEIDSQNDYILYPTFGNSYWDPDWQTGTCRIRRGNFHSGVGHRTLEAAKLFWNHPPEDLETKLGNPEVIHSNNFYCPRSLRKARLVYTLYDLSFFAHPEWTTEQNRTACFQGVFEASLYADLIIAISHFSRNHFLEIFPHYPGDRIAVVYPASRFQGQAGTRPPGLPPLLPDQFWLNVGVLEPRKNLRRLLRAHARLKAQRNETFPLVLAGGRGWLMDDFERDIETLNLQGNVVMLGYVEDEALRWLYRNCFAFIYPTLFEGFGMPVLEAMGLGAPIIASNVTSIPEIVGEAGILINPEDDQTISQAMASLLANPQFHMHFKEKSVQQASHFLWQTSASRVLELYHEVLSRPPLLPGPSSGPSRRGDRRSSVALGKFQ